MVKCCKSRNRIYGLTMIWAAIVPAAGLAQALPTADTPSRQAVTQVTPQKSQEFRRALDARIKMEMHRPEVHLTTHIDDLMARFIRPGISMRDAEALMTGAGLRRSKIVEKKQKDGLVLYLLEYQPSPDSKTFASQISKTLAVISIYPTAQVPPTVARTAAQINLSTL